MAKINPNTRNLILAFIADYNALYGRCPSVRNIAEGVGLASTSTVHGYLHRLRNAGLITFQPHCPRSVQVCK